MNKILMIAWILAGISSFVVPPDMEYLNYIDFHTLGLLFCLMAVMAGLSREGVFGQAAGRLITVVKNSRQMELILVFLCFVSSMLITNDVALITFVPFAIQVLEMAGMRKRIVPGSCHADSCGKFRKHVYPNWESTETFICIPNQEWH